MISQSNSTQAETHSKQELAEKIPISREGEETDLIRMHLRTVFVSLWLREIVESESFYNGTHKKMSYCSPDCKDFMIFFMIKL